MVLPPSCRYLCTVLLDHLPILFTNSMSAVAWYNAVAPPILSECERNLSGGSPTPWAALCSSSWTSVLFSTAPDAHLNKGRFPSPLVALNLCGHVPRILSSASTGHRNLFPVAFKVFDSPNANWSAFVLRNWRVTSSAPPPGANSPSLENFKSHPRTTLSSSTPPESENSLALSIKNHAVVRAATTTTQSAQAGVVFSASSGSIIFFPIHTSIPGVTPNLLGRRTACRSIAFVRIHSLCIPLVGSPAPPFLWASLMANSACFKVAEDEPSHPRYPMKPRILFSFSRLSSLWFK